MVYSQRNRREIILCSLQYLLQRPVLDVSWRTAILPQAVAELAEDDLQVGDFVFQAAYLVGHFSKCSKP